MVVSCHFGSMPVMVEPTRKTSPSVVSLSTTEPLLTRNTSDGAPEESPIGNVFAALVAGGGLPQVRT